MDNECASVSFCVYVCVYSSPRCPRYIAKYMCAHLSVLFNYIYI